MISLDKRFICSWGKWIFCLCWVMTDKSRGWRLHAGHLCDDSTGCGPCFSSNDWEGSCSTSNYDCEIVGFSFQLCHLCFVYFEALLLGPTTFLIMPFWRIDAPLHLPLSRSAALFILKLTSSHTDTATPAFTASCFQGNNIHSLNTSVSFCLKSISYRKLFYPFWQSLLLIEVFSSLSFNIIIDIFGARSFILLFECL